MIRVLHCVAGMNIGGLETFTMNIYRNIDISKVQFDFLVSFDGEYDNEIKALGGNIYKIPFITALGPIKYSKNLRNFFSEHNEYNIIHIQMDKFGGMIAREAKKCNISFRIVHSHSTKNEGGWIYNFIKNYYGSFINKNANHYLSCTDEASKWLFKEKAHEAIIIKNGIDLDIFSYNDMRKKEYLTIVHVGRFTKVKNHSFLLDVFYELKKLCPQARLLLVGEGPELEKIKEKTLKNGLQDAVSFLGKRLDVENILNQSDVFCMPSLFEGAPVSLVEAQACGVPCLVSDSIPKENDLTGDITFYSLQLPAKEWAKKLMFYKNKPKKNNRKILEDAGYSIKKSAKFLENYYLSLHSKSK